MSNEEVFSGRDIEVQKESAVGVGGADRLLQSRYF